MKYLSPPLLLFFSLLTHTLQAQITFGAEQILTTSSFGAESIELSDLDNDGDTDIVFLSNSNNSLSWFENDGFGSFAAAQLISNSDFNSNVMAYDIDGDLDADLISYTNGIAMYENLGGGIFGSPIYTSGTTSDVKSVSFIDLDNDSDKELIAISNGNNRIVSFENQGNFTFGSLQIVILSTSPDDGAVADLNGDNFEDFIYLGDGQNSVRWLENNTIGSLGTNRLISDTSLSPNYVDVGDMNGDGDIDVIASGNRITWFENDGTGLSWNEHYITNTNNGYFKLSDLNGDGNVDVLVAPTSGDEMVWYKNDGLGSFGPQQFISTNTPDISSVGSADLNGDNKIDVVSASLGDNKIAWYEGLFTPLPAYCIANPSVQASWWSNPGTTEYGTTVDPINTSYTDTLLFNQVTDTFIDVQCLFPTQVYDPVSGFGPVDVSALSILNVSGLPSGLNWNLDQNGSNNQNSYAPQSSRFGAIRICGSTSELRGFYSCKVDLEVCGVVGTVTYCLTDSINFIIEVKGSPVFEELTISACDSALVNGTWVGSTQVVVDTFVNQSALGNDSILTTSVLINTTSGQIQTSLGSPFVNAKVLLIEHYLSNDSLAIVDSTFTDNIGNYFFNQTSANQYVKIVPDQNQYPNEMPTYYNESATFQNASVVSCDSINSFNSIQGTNPGGPGFIGGYVGNGAGKLSEFGIAVSGLSILLLNSNGEIVAYTTTDANGYFSFDNIPCDVYEIWVDDATTDNNLAPILTISGPNCTEDSLQFTLTNDVLSRLNITSINSVDDQIEILVQPNPTSNSFLITLSDYSQQPEVSITNVLGQVVFQEVLLDNKNTIYSESWSNGLYQISLKSETGEIVGARKLVVNK